MTTCRCPPPRSSSASSSNGAPPSPSPGTPPTSRRGRPLGTDGIAQLTVEGGGSDTPLPDPSDAEEAPWKPPLPCYVSSGHSGHYPPLYSQSRAPMQRPSPPPPPLLPYLPPPSLPYATTTPFAPRGGLRAPTRHLLVLAPFIFSGSERAPPPPDPVGPPGQRVGVRLGDGVPRLLQRLPPPPGPFVAHPRGRRAPATRVWLGVLGDATVLPFLGFSRLLLARSTSAQPHPLRQSAFLTLFRARGRAPAGPFRRVPPRTSSSTVWSCPGGGAALSPPPPTNACVR